MGSGGDKMNCDCSIDDAENPEFFTEKLVKARKSHKCCECNREIRPGEQHERSTGKWDGEIDTFRTCFICRTIRNDYCHGGWEYGRLIETLWECLGINYVTGEVKP